MPEAAKPVPHPPPHEELALGELIRLTLIETKELASAEIQLAKVELQKATRRLVRLVILSVLGAVGALLGLVALMHAMAAALVLVLPAWAAYLISGGLAMGMAGALAWLAYRRLDQLELAPERAIESTKDNIEWLKKKLD